MLSHFLSPLLRFPAPTPLTHTQSTWSPRVEGAVTGDKQGWQQLYPYQGFPLPYFWQFSNQHCVSESWPTPSHLSRLSQSTRFDLPHHIVNSHWLMYMIQCYSLSSSHLLIFKLVRNILITSVLKHFTLCTTEWVSPPFTEWTVHWMQLLSGL